MSITLKPLNVSNWEECAKLEVAKDQEGNLAGNLFLIAELNFYPQTKAFVITIDQDEIIGFTTFGIQEGEGTAKIFRLMIDKNHQGKGHGKSALVEIVKKMLAEKDTNEIHVCYNPTKEELKKFYGSVGFEEKELLPCQRRPEGKMLAILKREDFLQ